MENHIKKLLIICLLSIFYKPFLGQNIFFQSYGGSGNDYGENIISTRDSGFLAIGATESYGNGLTDMYFVKTDKDGNVLWHKAYGGANIEMVYFNGVKVLEGMIGILEIELLNQ